MSKTNLKTIDQQQKHILQNQQVFLDHLFEVQKKTISDTNDLDIENKMMLYKFNPVNNQLKVYKTTQKQHTKLVKAKAKNDSLKTNLELQKQMKKLQIEKEFIDATIN